MKARRSPKSAAPRRARTGAPACAARARVHARALPPHGGSAAARLALLCVSKRLTPTTHPPAPVHRFTASALPARTFDCSTAGRCTPGRCPRCWGAAACRESSSTRTARRWRRRFMTRFRTTPAASRRAPTRGHRAPQLRAGCPHAFPRRTCGGLPARCHARGASSPRARMQTGSGVSPQVLARTHKLRQRGVSAGGAKVPALTRPLPRAPRGCAAQILERPHELRGDFVPMNSILAHDVTVITADFFLQSHSTNPFLTTATVDKAIAAFLVRCSDAAPCECLVRRPAQLACAACGACL
jgi:hypothetical protein